MRSAHGNKRGYGKDASSRTNRQNRKRISRYKEYDRYWKEQPKMSNSLVKAAHVGMTHAEPVVVDVDSALSIAEAWAGHAFEMQLRYEEYDLDDDHVVVAVFDDKGHVALWLWVEYEPLPCTKR